MKCFVRLGHLVVNMILPANDHAFPILIVNVTFTLIETPGTVCALELNLRMKLSRICV